MNNSTSHEQQETLIACIHALEALVSKADQARQSILRILKTLHSKTRCIDSETIQAFTQTPDDLLTEWLSGVLAELQQQIVLNDDRYSSRVLISSIDSEMILAIQQCLASSQREIFTASSISQTEELLNDQDIDLLILDTDLVDGDGRDLLMLIREQPRQNALPIIIVSARQEPEYSNECIALGADLVFSKPLSLQTLVMAVTAQLQRVAYLNQQTRQAQQDNLTRLPNRAACTIALERALATARRHQRSLSVALIDLDHFKEVNDSYGHANGDRVLRHAADVVGKSIRTADYLARWGGEEFVIIFPDTDQHKAAQVLERALQALRSSPVLTDQGQPLNITFSAGVASAQNQQSIEAIVDAADQLLYLAKASGRNRVLSARQDNTHATACDGLDSQSAQLPEVEQRQLTVLALALKDRNGALAQLSETGRNDLRRHYFSVCRTIVERFQGTVIRDSGDYMLVYFGYPVAYEKSVQQAVRAGTECVKTISISAIDTTADIAGAIHTGYAVMPASIRVENNTDLALGDTPAYALQLAGAADGGDLLLSEMTRRLLDEHFQYCRIPEADLTPVNATTVYRLLITDEDSSDEAFHRELQTEQFMTPFIGREADLTLLQNRWVQASGGMGQAVLISGEAGIGKSRLLQAFKQQLNHLPHTQLECRCFAQHDSSALYPIAQLTRQMLQLVNANDSYDNFTALDNLFKSWQLDSNETVPLLASLLSLQLPEQGYTPPQWSAQRQKQRTFEIVLMLLSQLSRQQPLLLIIEDLHWADPSTLEFLSLLLDQLPTMRLCLLGSYRLDFQIPWSNRSHLSFLTLNRLSAQDVDRLLDHLTAEHSIPEPVRHYICAKTDGVPLFVEELTKMLLETGSARQIAAGDHQLTAADTIPATLHSSLAARLDHLGSAKRIAQIASVLGRSFSFQVLQALTQTDEVVLLRELERLVNAELLYQRDLPPRAHYTFKHALIQEAAYQSLLAENRQKLHIRAALVLLSSHPNIIKTQPELLAHHFSEGHDHQQALQHWKLAAELAVSRSALVEAKVHFRNGLMQLQHLPDSREKKRQELDLQMALGPVLMALKGQAALAVEEVYDRVYQLCQALSDNAQLFPALWGLWRIYLNRPLLQSADDAALKLLNLAQQQQKSDMLLEAHIACGTTQWYLGNFAAARKHITQAQALYEPKLHQDLAKRFGGCDPGVYCLSYSALILWHLGYPDQARQTSRKALSQARKLKQPYSLAFALNFANVLDLLLRDYGDSDNKIAEQISIATRQDFTLWRTVANIYSAQYRIQQGDSASGLAQLQEKTTEQCATGAELALPFWLSFLAQAQAECAQVTAGLESLIQATELAEKTGERQWLAEIYRLRGTLLLTQPEPEELEQTQHEARQCFQQAISISQQQQAKSQQLRATISLARLLQQQKNNREAYELLAPLYDEFSEGFDTVDLREASELLAELRSI